MAIRMTAMVPGLVVLLAASAAPAQDANPPPGPPPATCHAYGDKVVMEGVVAERRVRKKSDGEKTSLFLFRPGDICVVEKEGKKKVDKLRLVSTTDAAQYSAMSLVSGNRVRVEGELVLLANPEIVANAIDVTRVTDLEAEGGPSAIEPEIPLSISFRNAILSSGQVAQFKNETKSPLAVTVEFFRPATEARKSQDLVIDPEGKREIGEREGWAFVKDDRITVSRKGMKTFTVIAP